MTNNLATLRRLLVAATVAVAVGALSTGTAGAALLVGGGTTGQLTLGPGIDKCVTVVVPSTSVTVNAKLKVKAAGVKSATRSSTKLSIPNRTLQVCVHADADARIALNADALVLVGSSGTVVNVTADVVAQTAVTVKVTANGVRIL